MSFTFLHEELESILLFVTAPIYLTIVGVLQSKNLKILVELKRKKTSDDDKSLLLDKLKRLKRRTPLFMLLGVIVHVVLYLIFSHNELRPGYFISMSVMYIIYVAIAWVNFYLKGAGILKDIGGFNGLPGN